MAITQLTSYTAKNVGLTTATVFTASAGVQTVINGLTVANVTNVATSASVLITRGGVDVYVVRDATVYPGGSMVVAGWDQKIALIAGDQLKAVTTRATSADVFVSAVLSGEAAAGSQSVIIAPSVTPSTASPVPGTPVVFSIANVLPASGTYYWTINGPSITSADFAGGALNGTVAISGGAGTVSLTLNNSGYNKSWQLQLRTVSISGTVIAVSPIMVASINLVSSSLVFNLDAGNALSYPSAGTNWNNLVSGGANGVLVNGPTYNSANSGSIVFDGVDDYVDLGTSLSSQVGSSITVGAFAQISSVVSKNTLISFNGIYNFFLPGNRLTTTYQLYWDSVSGWKNGNTTSWTTNQWYYFAWTISSTSLTFYLNGVADGTVSITNPIAPSGQVRIGFANAGEYATGRIANVHVYNSALSAGDILQNFNALRSRYSL